MKINIINETELLDIVDESDVVIGKDTKENKFSKNLISRTAVCFIKDNEGKLIIVKRSPSKKSFPNRYDLAACGNVKSGETYEEAIKREIKEELGIKCAVVPVEKIFNQFIDNGKELRYFTTIFLGIWNGDIELNEELTEFQKLDVGSIERMINEDRNQFTPGFVNDFERLKQKLLV